MPLFGVSREKYDAAVANNNVAVIEYKRLANKYAALLKKFNDLVERVNHKGGEEFLNRAVMPDKVGTQLSTEDVKRLIQLCHPDKHDGKLAAVEMTKKLLSLRT